MEPFILKHRLLRDHHAEHYPLMRANGRRSLPPVSPPSPTPALASGQPQSVLTWKATSHIAASPSTAIKHYPASSASISSLYSVSSLDSASTRTSNTHSALQLTPTSSYGPSVIKHVGLTCDERTEDNFKVQPSQAQSDDDGVELVQSAESECDLSDYLTMTSQWSDEDEQVEWWHLPPSNMVSDSSTSSSLTTVTPLPTSQLSTTQRRTEKVDVDVDVEVDVESDEEEKGEGEEDVDVVRRLQEEKYKTCCCDANCTAHCPLPSTRSRLSWFKRLRRRLRYLFASCYCCHRCAQPLPLPLPLPHSH
ncbi:hypothetical protein TcWFU_000714 [Taenia crassiceps]|uniref:Uncharacterized protein n=1 Tax=Taenia crassiceps TaxID=6207 RepID=A0ABR4QG02_9CEST